MIPALRFVFHGCEKFVCVQICACECMWCVFRESSKPALLHVAELYVADRNVAVCCCLGACMHEFVVCLKNQIIFVTYVCAL